VILGLREAAEAIGCAGVPAVTVSGYSIDSRTTVSGDLFFALRGEHRDAHEFVGQAFEHGAAAAVVERPIGSGPLLVVEDTVRAMQTLAAWARRRWSGVVVGVTGSAGKTTTKDLIAHLLAVEMPVGKTGGNYNNHIGLPLSLLRLPDDARAGVLELGMNHPGEIRALAAIARPSIGVVTNVGYAHMEFFDSLDQVALAKRELIEALPPDGVAVLNADDPRVRRFRDVHPGPVVTFGFSSGADVRAEEVEPGPEGTRFLAGGCRFETTQIGRPAVLNLLAALAVARVFGLPFERLREPVRSFLPLKMRGERFAHRGITVWNDCYNSNPDAARAMLDALRVTPARRRIAVLGEMLELGRWAQELHRDVGCHVAQCEISLLVGIRGAARAMVDAAIASGLDAGAAYFFDEPEPAGDLLRTLAGPGDVILFKGSRGTRVEKALERFLA